MRNEAVTVKIITQIFAVKAYSGWQNTLIEQSNWVQMSDVEMQTIVRKVVLTQMMELLSAILLSITQTIFVTKTYVCVYRICTKKNT